jgi:ligand-binding sensor domain-containing protein/signal transduction histidine kinase
MRLLLRNSSTSRKGSFGRRWLFHRFLTAVALLCSALPARAVDPDRAISHYIRDRWGSEKGFPGRSVSAIAQTSDGYLWIGTEKGLIRFDGLNFQVFEHAAPSSLPIGGIQQLMADGDGNLWIVLQSTQILRHRDGKFELGREEAELGITSVGRRRDGTVLLSSLAFGTLAYRGGKYEILTSPSEIAAPETTATAEADTRNTRLSWAIGFRPQRFANPNSPVTAMIETADDKVWLGTRDKGLFYMSQGRVFAAGKGLPKSQINCFLAFQNREMWIGTDSGMVRWDGSEVTSSGVPDGLRHVPVFSMIRDRNSNIWVGTARGLIRVNAKGVSADRAGPQTSQAVTALFEDREGNLWTGGPSGIQRLRDSAFVTYSVANGLPSDKNGPVYVDEQARLWFAPLEGGLYWAKGEQIVRVRDAGLDRDVVYSISGRANELWIGRQRGGLTLLRETGHSVTVKTYTQADGLAQNSVYAVHQSRDGTVWAGTLDAGVSALRNGRFTTYTTANVLSSNTVTSMAESPDGTMWFATSNGLNAFSNGRWRVFTVNDGMPSADVNCVLADSMGVLWIGGTAGLAFLISDHVQVPLEALEPLHEQVLGIAEDRNGWLWIATSSHVLRIKRDRLLRNESSDADVREYGLSDGLLGTEGVRRHHSVFADPTGKIWFSMNRGLSVVDPNQATVNSAPALVHMESVMVDGTAINRQIPIRFSSARQRVTFSYTGLNLSNSEGVKYRYRLDGFDRDWSDPTTIQTAIYTNLTPRPYRFRVMASNSDGLWNGPEAVVGFEVEPTIWQTWWVRLILVFCAGLVALGVYRLRISQLARVLNMRFQERLAERTRIAQDLHDTLLQGVLSASMQMHVAVDGLAEDSPARPAFDHILQLMRQIVEEGRNTVRGLRSSIDDANDLQNSFSRIPQELGKQAAGFRLMIEGEALALHSAIRDEVYRIGREALVNAFRHSRASNVDLHLKYAAKELRILVRDDGCGIDPQVLQLGRDGHWGLRGMRERAERIGARLKVLSRPGSGTEVELRVPSNVAFGSHPARPASKLIAWLPGGPQKTDEYLNVEPDNK